MPQKCLKSLTNYCFFQEAFHFIIIKIFAFFSLPSVFATHTHTITYTYVCTYVCIYIYFYAYNRNCLGVFFYQFCHRVASKHIYYCMTTVQPKSMCKQPCMSVKKEIIYKMNKNEKNHRKQLKNCENKKKLATTTTNICKQLQKHQPSIKKAMEKIFQKLKKKGKQQHTFFFPGNYKNISRP